MTIGFIGTGNMGGALIKALAPRYPLCAFNRGRDKLLRVCEATGAVNDLTVSRLMQLEGVTALTEAAMDETAVAALCEKALDAANKLIAELKAKIASLTKELSEYKSARGKLQAAGLEQENEALRSKLRSYEAVIERNTTTRWRMPT